MVFLGKYGIATHIWAKIDRVAYVKHPPNQRKPVTNTFPQGDVDRG